MNGYPGQTATHYMVSSTGDEKDAIADCKALVSDPFAVYDRWRGS
ncbi:MAG: hypothetical protein ABR915_01860 [Thermoguttaceae bacterium]